MVPKNFRFVPWCLLWPLLFFVACQPRFEEVAPPALERAWNESMRNSADRWWYLGAQDGFHFLVQEKPLRKKGFKVSTDRVRVLPGSSVVFSNRHEDWINLKVGQIQFSG